MTNILLKFNLVYYTSEDIISSSKMTWADAAIRNTKQTMSNSNYRWIPTSLRSEIFIKDEKGNYKPPKSYRK